MTVYADVLIAVNLFVNYALLLCSAKIMKMPVSRLRILFGASVGSIYGLVIFLPELPVIIGFPMRAAAAAFIVFCTFGFSGTRRFLRCFFTFFAVSMAFGGIMLFIWMTAAPIGMVFNNGTVYFDIDIAVLAVSTVVCFAVVSLISFFVERRAPKESAAWATISFHGKSVKLNALIDTGNSLRESFSGYPVAVAELSSMKNILPEAVLSYIQSGKYEENTNNFRLILHNTVSGTGPLPAFKPDYIEIKTLSRTVRTDKVYIAVTKSNIAKGEYQIILNPDLLSEEKAYAENL